MLDEPALDPALNLAFVPVPSLSFDGLQIGLAERHFAAMDESKNAAPEAGPAAISADNFRRCRLVGVVDWAGIVARNFVEWIDFLIPMQLLCRLERDCVRKRFVRIGYVSNR